MIYENVDLEIKSKTDVLTGIHNRRAIMRELEMRYKQALANDMHLSITMFDLDHFKKVNDENGHQYGDMVLTTVANVISQSIKK